MQFYQKVVSLRKASRSDKQVTINISDLVGIGYGRSFNKKSMWQGKKYLLNFWIENQDGTYDNIYEYFYINRNNLSTLKSIDALPSLKAPKVGKPVQHIVMAIIPLRAQRRPDGKSKKAKLL